MFRGRLVLIAVVAAALGALAPVASAADAFFPGNVPPPTQISRDLTLSQAAQAGVIDLDAKGGPEGDAVSLTLKHKKISGPINVTVRAEFTVAPRITPDNRQRIAESLQQIARATEAAMNAPGYKTQSGDPLTVRLIWTFRDPEAAPNPSYHQVQIINPAFDLEEADPDYRAQLEGLPTPNRTGEDAVINAKFPVSDVNPKVLSHEMFHFAGLDDRYIDVYRVPGKPDLPLPERAMPPSQLAAYVKSHGRPGPPAGSVRSADTPGTGRCDIMGSGEHRACRRLSKRALKWFETQAAIQVTANPGDILANKETDRQNFGVASTTTVLTTPGSSTTANGVAVYCLDKGRFIPFQSRFDVLGPGRDVPGYAPAAALLELASRLQPTLNETVDGMQAALWNITDAAPLDTSGTAEQSRALLSQAGVPEDAVPGGLPDFVNPNAGSADTGAVTPAGEVVPTAQAPVTTVVPPTVAFAQLYPKRVPAGRRPTSTLMLSTTGDGTRVKVSLQRKVGRRWKAVRSLSDRPVISGTRLIPLRLGRVSAGSYRVVVTVTPLVGPAAVLRPALTVTRS